jgi:hypothetical protein
MVMISILWILALPHHSLWKRTYIDENAISPGQVSMYFDWANVHQADKYLDELEKIVNGTFEQYVVYSQLTWTDINADPQTVGIPTRDLLGHRIAYWKYLAIDLCSCPTSPIGWYRDHYIICKLGFEGRWPKFKRCSDRVSSWRFPQRSFNLVISLTIGKRLTDRSKLLGV